MRKLKPGEGIALPKFVRIGVELKIQACLTL